MRKSTMLVMGVLLLGMGTAQAEDNKDKERFRERPHTRLYCRYHREIIGRKGKGPAVPAAIEECWARARVCNVRDRDRDRDGLDLLNTLAETNSTGGNNTINNNNNNNNDHDRERRRCRDRIEVACTNGFFYRDGAHRSFHNGWEYLNGNIGGDPSIKFEGGRIFDFDDEDRDGRDRRDFDAFETISFLRAGGIEFGGHCRVLRDNHRDRDDLDDELGFSTLSEANATPAPSVEPVLK